MKRGQIKFSLVLISVLVLLTTSLAQEQLKPLEDYNLEEWKSLDLESKNQVWKTTPDPKKISFLKTNYFKDINIQGLNHETLFWQEGEILGNEKTWIDLTQILEGLKSLGYDGEKFIYDFGDGKVETGVGSLEIVDGELKLVGSEGYEDFSFTLNNNGIIRITEEGIFFKNAELKIGERTFKQNNPDHESYIKIFKEDFEDDSVEHYKVDNVEVISEKIDIKTPQGIETDVIFNSKLDYTKKGYSQYAQVLEDIFLMSGKDISASLKDDFKNIIANSIEGKLTLIDGDLKIDFEGAETRSSVERAVNGEIPFRVDKIINKNNEEKYLVIEESPDGDNYLRDHQFRTIVGKVYYNLGDSLEEQRRLASILGFSSRIGKVDESEIPEDASEQEYHEAVKNSKYKSVEVSILKKQGGGITDYEIEKGIGDAIEGYVSELFGVEITPEIRQAIRDSENAGELTDEQQRAKRITEISGELAKAVVGSIARNQERIGSSEFRQPERLQRGARLLGNLFDARLLEGVVPEPVSGPLKQALDIAPTMEVFLQYSHALAKVHNTYGLYPYKMKISMEMRGDKAYGIVSAPPVREGNEIIRMDPIEFEIPIKTADRLIKRTFDEPPIKKQMWNQRQERN